MKKALCALHLLLMVYSVNSIFSKMAAGESFMSFKWCAYYAVVVLLLGVYALGWQQILKRMPLTSAYANKAVTTIWGLVWGVLFFDETVTIGKIIGIAMIMAGVVLSAFSDKDSENCEGASENKEGKE